MEYRIMETLAKTEYQDLYRIVDGVLLVVNKFEKIKYQGVDYISVNIRNAKCKSYNKGCQSWLKELTKDFYYEWMDITIPKGTVLYINIPVQSTNDKSKWKYSVKTTSSCLGGSYNDVKRMLNQILELMDGENNDSI